jgi:aldose 1-epimerase
MAAWLGYCTSPLWLVMEDLLGGPPRGLTVDEAHATHRRLAPAHFTRHQSGWDGVATLALVDGRHMIMRASSRLTQHVVHRPDPPGYVCTEAVSHVANGFNLAGLGVSGTGTRTLAWRDPPGS